VVSFSGGRDSSAILAVAADVARSEGLDLPVPMTLRFPGAPRSHEDEWQELVVRHLGLAEWSRVELGGELDVVGPWARPLLVEIGPYWPRNLHFLMPLVAEATGGSVLTGVGGDETFVPYLTRRRILAAAARRARPPLRELVLVLLPPVLRRPLLRRSGRLRVPWLRPAAQEALARKWARLNARSPSHYQRQLDAFLRGRYHELLSSMPLVGQSHGVAVVSPFLDLRFQAALARDLPRTGFVSRTQGMTDLFGDLLPAAVLGRSTKAAFTELFWSDQARSFAATWNGAGVDEDLVDPDALSEQWKRPIPSFRSYGLLQQVWLASTGPPRGSGPLTPKPGPPANPGPPHGHPSFVDGSGGTSEGQ
jgi:asparagine synthase (glutamine-hydrolysing)